ncbi:hypothetical protein RYX36_022775, partial [Vicia faba]
MVIGYAPRSTKTYVEKTSSDFAIGELYWGVKLGSDRKPLAKCESNRKTNYILMINAKNRFK